MVGATGHCVEGRPLDWSDYLDYPDEDVPELQKAIGLAPAWRALRNVIGQSPEDFVLRASALHALQNTQQASIERGDLDGALHYITGVKREGVIRALQEGDWIEHHEGRWRLTSLGIDLYNILLVLFELGSHPYMAFSTLLFSVIKDLQGDPEMSIRGLINQMNAMRNSIHTKIEMRSSIALKGEVERARSAIKMASIAQQAADDVRLTGSNPELFQDLHRATAHLLRANEELNEALAAVAAAHVSLPAGYTPHDIIESLSRCDPELLERVGRSAHLITLPKRLDLHEDAITGQAVAYIERERFEPDLTIPEEETPEDSDDLDMPRNEHLEELARIINEYPAEEVPVLAALGDGPPHEILHRFFALDYLEVREEGNIISSLGAKLERSDDDVEGDAVRFVTQLKILKEKHAQR